jgi:hypothetical protein
VGLPWAQDLSRADRTAEQADYCLLESPGCLADLANRHDVKPGIIPERCGGGSTSRASPQDTADQAAVSAYNRQSPADRLRGKKS